MSIKSVVSVIDRDRGFRKLVDVMRRSKKALLVGLPGESGNRKHPDGNLTLADLASYLEFGTDTIPARPFLSGTIDANMSAYKKASETIADKVVTGQLDLERGLEALGERILTDIRRNIIAGVPPGNAPATILKKGSSTPLIDTGHLLGSLNYQVVEAK